MRRASSVKVPWADALAPLVRASLAASVAGQDAWSRLDAAERALERRGWRTTPPRRYRRGQLLGGDEGRMLVEEGRRALMPAASSTQSGC